jgi:hypothetical protein
LVGWIRIGTNRRKIETPNKGDGTLVVGGRLYFSFHPKCSKLGTLLQRDANDEENEEKIQKILTVRLALKSLSTDLGAGVHVLEDGQLLVRIHLDQVLSKINDEF